LLQEVRLNKAAIQATEAYLDALSKRIFLLTHRKLKSNFSVPAYVLLAFLIERRIMKIYPHLARHGASEHVRKTARELIHDERKHLTFVNNKLVESLELSGTTKNEILEMEAALAETWLKRILDAVHQ
jgi:rubrerythrin